MLNKEKLSITQISSTNSFVDFFLMELTHSGSRNLSKFNSLLFDEIAPEEVYDNELRSNS